MKEEKWEAIIGQIREFADSGVSGIIHGVTTDPVTGNEYIFSQIEEILIMAVCGACIAFLFEVYEGIYAMAMAGKEGGGKEKMESEEKNDTHTSGFSVLRSSSSDCSPFLVYQQLRPYQYP